jgi:hypothetical protein
MPGGRRALIRCPVDRLTIPAGRPITERADLLETADSKGKLLPRPGKPVSERKQPRRSHEAPEGLLLFLLVATLAITVASLLLARHPAASILVPIAETESR